MSACVLVFAKPVSLLEPNMMTREQHGACSAHGRKRRTRLVVGLGQGLILRRCRHAIGARLVEELARTQALTWHLYPTLGAYVASHTRPSDGGVTLLVWPLVSYNISGVVVEAVARRFRVAPSDVTVLHDDLDVKVGSLKWRSKGSAGGNGVKSIIAQLETDEFPRLRIGVGRPPTSVRVDVVRYVLSDMPEQDVAHVTATCAKEGIAQQLLDGPTPSDALAAAVGAVASPIGLSASWLVDGMRLAMSVVGAYLSTVRTMWSLW